MATYPHVNKAHQYCRDVLSGKIDACLQVKQACKRHLDDLEKSRDKNYRWRFDKEKAERVCEFIECLVHVKGEWAGKLIILEPWQCFIECCIFGWVDKKTGYRRFTKAEIYVPRKNGKSVLAAGTADYMFLADGEAGAEVYSGATSEKQAWEVFRPAKQMIEKSPDIKEFFGVDVFAKSMFSYESASRFEPVVGKPGDGSSPHLATVDEYHEHDTSELYDTMATGMGARRQPLMFVISTAGVNLAGPCKESFDELIKVLAGVTENDRLFGIIYTIDKEDDWRDYKNWKKANPNYGISPTEDFIQQQYQTAMQSPGKRNIILCKHLNMWLSVNTAWMDMQKLEKCADITLVLDAMRGKRCVGALDLSSKIDLSALMLVFWDDVNVYLFGKYYSCRGTVDKPENSHFQAWEHQELLTVTEGERIDYGVIKEDVLELHANFEPDFFAFDPTFAAQLCFDLTNEGVTMVEVKQTVLQFSDPMKELEADVLSGKLRYNGCKMLTWMFSNVVAHYDKKENIFPNKTNRKNKIDGVVAAIMGYNGMMRVKTTPKAAEPGIIVI